MASFVREVLSAAGQLSEKEDFNGKASKLKNRVDSLKFQMREKIESRLVFRKTREIIFLNFGEPLLIGWLNQKPPKFKIICKKVKNMI